MRKNMISKVVLILLTSVIVGGCSNVLVKTDVGNITEEDLTSYLTSSYGQVGLIKLLETKLLSKEYQVPSDEINEEFDRVKMEQGKQFEVNLSKQNLTEEKLKEQLKIELQKKQVGIELLDITNEKLVKFHKKWQPPAKIQHILVKDEKLVRDLKNKLDKGEKFDDLAQKYSVDQTTKNQGGLWSEFTKGVSLVSFEEQVFKLVEKNSISEPFKTVMGWHIVKMIDPAIKKDLKEDEAQVKNAYIKEYLTSDVIDKGMENLVKRHNVTVSSVKYKEILSN